MAMVLSARIGVAEPLSRCPDDQGETEFGRNRSVVVRQRGRAVGGNRRNASIARRVTAMARSLPSIHISTSVLSPVVRLNHSPLRLLRESLSSDPGWPPKAGYRSKPTKLSPVRFARSSARRPPTILLKRGDSRGEHEGAVVAGALDDERGNDGSDDARYVADRGYCTPTQVPAARGPANIWATA